MTFWLFVAMLATLVLLLALAYLPLGDYEIKIVIKDRVSDGQTIEAKGKFTVTK